MPVSTATRCPRVSTRGFLDHACDSHKKPPAEAGGLRVACLPTSHAITASNRGKCVKSSGMDDGMAFTPGVPGLPPWASRFSTPLPQKAPGGSRGTPGPNATQGRALVLALAEDHPEGRHRRREPQVGEVHVAEQPPGVAHERQFVGVDGRQDPAVPVAGRVHGCAPSESRWAGAGLPQARHQDDGGAPVSLQHEKSPAGANPGRAECSSRSEARFEPLTRLKSRRT
jgi:hypothetical protein